jgi:hypothetical protein
MPPRRLYKRAARGPPCWRPARLAAIGRCADTHGLRRRVFNAIAFRRTPVSAGSASEGQAVPGGPARRRVEQ